MAVLPVRAARICGENCRQVKNRKTKTSCPVLGFSRRETFSFELRFDSFASPNFEPPNSRAEARLFGAFDGPRRLAAPDPRHGRPPCNARVSLLSCTCKHGAPAPPLQANAMPHTHLPWHDEPQLHSTKATAVHDHFQQHFTTFTLMVAAGRGAEYPAQ